MDALLQKNRSPTAFVLAGGGSLGAIEVGMLRALLEWGEMPAFVVGASAGALNAAFFAGDPTLAGVRRLGNVWRSVRRRDVFPINLSSVVAGLFGRSGYMVDPYGLRVLIDGSLGYQCLEQAILPVHVVATDVTTGREVVLSSGNAAEAILASTAIPGVLPPVRIGSHTLVDGAVSNNAPISVAVALGAKRVVVLPTGFACARRGTGDGVVPRAMHAISLMIAAQLVRDAQHWMGSHIELRIVPSICPLFVSPYDFSAAEELMMRAHVATEVWLDNGGLELGEIPGQLSPHEHQSN